MKDKVKGLILGLSMGIMLTGTAAYASGSQIEVYFRELKYMFDGNEKVPTAEQGQGLIYNGTTYVPLRFVSEALGKEVGFDNDTGTIWVGKRIDLNQVIATYQGGEVTLRDLNRRMAIYRAVNPSNEQFEKDPSYQQYILNEIIGYRILASRVSEEAKPDLNKKADLQLKQELAYIQKNAGTDNLTDWLSKKGTSEQELRWYYEQTAAVEAVLSAGISDSDLQSAYTERLASGQYTIASVRHILIGFTDPAGNKRTNAEAKAKAQQLADKLKKGEDFAALAKQESEDPGSKNNGGLYENAPVTNWVEPFKKATLTLKLNEISEPVETEYGYHVIRVEKRSDESFEKVKDSLRMEMIGAKYEEFKKSELNGLITNVQLPQ